jgi:hypothetical protein
MDTNTITEGRTGPWNKGKLLGQRPPLKLREIWAIRIRLQSGHRAREARTRRAAGVRVASSSGRSVHIASAAQAKACKSEAEQRSVPGSGTEVCVVVTRPSLKPPTRLRI